MVKYLKHSRVDKARWDRCIDQSENGLIYAYSWYLDIVSPEWDALVLNDYEAVMPLPWKKKWGVKYIYQPPYCRQLGVFSANRLVLENVSSFIRKIPKSFLHVHQNLNTANSLNNTTRKRLSDNLTCWVDLNKSYEKLYAGFSKNHKKNIRKALKNNLIINEIEQGLFVKNYLLYYSEKGLLEKFLFIEQTFPELINGLIKNADTRFFGIYLEGELIASFVQIEKNERILIHTAMTNIGRKKGAVYFLINSIIEKNAESEKILDFAGSNIESIRYRNEGFGSETEVYRSLYYYLTPIFSKKITKVNLA